MSRTKKQVNALVVAQYFLKRAQDEGEKITNKKLQKLVYYAQVWSLVINKERLFRESIEAWVHGPAIPSLYRRFKGFESNPITTDLSDIDFSFSKKQSELLDDVWEVYGKYDAEYLEALTHSELPWREAREGLTAAEPSSRKIDLNKAREYYERKLKESQ
ncbi:MAG: SocA family protein [Candidatus Harrisonbacteria bacterium]|nr:SocA family protein [Candidatus Harrisonbacteria bacterium]